MSLENFLECGAIRSVIHRARTVVVVLLLSKEISLLLPNRQGAG